MHEMAHVSPGPGTPEPHRPGVCQGGRPGRYVFFAFVRYGAGILKRVGTHAHGRVRSASVAFVVQVRRRGPQLGIIVCSGCIRSLFEGVPSSSHIAYMCLYIATRPSPGSPNVFAMCREGLHKHSCAPKSQGIWLINYGCVHVCSFMGSLVDVMVPHNIRVPLVRGAFLQVTDSMEPAEIYRFFVVSSG